MRHSRRGCNPDLPKIPLPPLQVCHDRIQVEYLPFATEGVVPVQMNVAPSLRRDLIDQSERFSLTGGLIFREQPRQNGEIVIDDRVCDQPRTRVADLDSDVGPASQFLFSAYLCNS